MLIFSYGSNMLLAKLHVNVPSATKVCNAYLPGYEFSFNKLSRDGSCKANVMKTGSNDHRVWGVIYEVDPAEKLALDREEGLSKGYNERLLTVYRDDLSAVETLVYVADESAIHADLEPYDWYWEIVMRGAEENELNQSYYEFLRSFHYIIDFDEDRSRLRHKILNVFDNKPLLVY